MLCASPGAAKLSPAARTTTGQQWCARPAFFTEVGKTKSGVQDGRPGPPTWAELLRARRRAPEMLLPLLRPAGASTTQSPQLGLGAGRPPTASGPTPRRRQRVAARDRPGATRRGQRQRRHRLAPGEDPSPAARTSRAPVPWSVTTPTSRMAIRRSRPPRRWEPERPRHRRPPREPHGFPAAHSGSRRLPAWRRRLGMSEESEREEVLERREGRRCNSYWIVGPAAALLTAARASHEQLRRRREGGEGEWAVALGEISKSPSGALEKVHSSGILVLPVHSLYCTN